MALKLYLTEMPRPAGGFSKHFRAALEAARQHGGAFTVKQFAEWLAAAGATNTNPMSVGTSLKRFAAGTPGKPRRPDDQHPLVMVNPGRRGKGGSATYQYALRKKMVGIAGKGAETASSAFDDMDLGAAGAPQEPYDAERPGVGQPDDSALFGGMDDDEGEFSGEPEAEPTEPHARQAPDEEDTVDDAEPVDADDSDGGEFDSEEEPDDDENDDDTYWIPKPDIDGSYAETSMLKLNDAGFGPDNAIWQEIGKSKNQMDADRVIRSSKLPMNLRTRAQAVAKQIFQNQDRMGDWDGKSESRLLSLYRLSEAPAGEDEDIPSPEKRGNISVGRLMPNYGMDEAQLDQVDFVQLHGVKRKDR